MINRPKTTAQLIATDAALLPAARVVFEFALVSLREASGMSYASKPFLIMSDAEGVAERIC